jgi:hypothetical protein
VAILFAMAMATALAASACGTAPATSPGTGSATSPGTGSATSQGTSSGETTTLASPVTASPGTNVTDITMPPPDSPNVPIYTALGWYNVYVLYWLKMQDGWAYVHGIPFTTTEGPTLDTRALLRQDAGGTWQVVEKSVSEGLLTDVGAVAEDEQVPRQFREAHPEAPAAIFPEVQTEDRLIMDGVRTALGNPGYRFNVFLLNNIDGWAYTELRALSYVAGRTSDSREERALLKNVDGVWTVQQMESMGDAASSDFTGRLKQQYPDLPAGLLP